MNRLIFILLLPLFLFGKFQVTTFFPLETYIANYIGKDEIRIKQINNRYVNIKREISQFDLTKLADVKVYVHLGLDIEKEYESVFKKFNPYIKIVNLSENIQLIDNNPYFWTDPINLRTIAKTVYDAFCEADKDNCDFYKINYESFISEADKTFLLIKNKLYVSEVQSVYVFDDRWNYFAKRFRLNLIKIENRFVKLDEINNLLKKTKEHNVLKLIHNSGESIDVPRSIARNANIELIEASIYEENIFLNLKQFSQNLTK